MNPLQIIIAVSALGGVIGGMGMGGGTLLIPLLTMFAGIEQHLAQCINLIAFIPMSVVALVIHGKNGYVKLSAVPIAVIALIGAVGGSFFAAHAKGYVLRACFGAFLIALGLYQLVKLIVQIVKKRKSNLAKNTQ